MPEQSTSAAGPGCDVPIAVSIGSNLGPRRELLVSAVTSLADLLDDLHVSSLYETEPLHLPDQPRFLNACCTGRTTLAPLALLRRLLDIERRAGRDRAGPRYGPRTLDLDVLLVGEMVVREPGLEVPHPRLRERAFVLVPLAEIAPEWIVPESQGRPAAAVADLASRIDASGVRRLAGAPWW
ncbi:MAG: 2-amino-4-hydroxy-6-hydroxymethyldihydropteridine diphosphokinase [Gemmatimonadota bacterium]|nr:2-amino-4-hydroxy-6-hydroxymethyldihydropteridine diphosphokinase [Gemmatimonadota bacterium]